MIFVTSILFVLGAIKAAGWLHGGPVFWFWGLLGFAAWALCGVVPSPTFSRKQGG